MTKQSYKVTIIIFYKITLLGSIVAHWSVVVFEMLLLTCNSLLGISFDKLHVCCLGQSCNQFRGRRKAKWLNGNAITSGYFYLKL